MGIIFLWKHTKKDAFKGKVRLGPNAKANPILLFPLSSAPLSYTPSHRLDKLLYIPLGSRFLRKTYLCRVLPLA